MQPPQTTLLPDGKRLHLHHGPIDLIIEAWGTVRSNAYKRATQRFQTILQELVAELPTLRAPLSTGSKPPQDGLRRLQTPCTLADRMRAAIDPFAPEFITPMAAIAGAVADEILAHLIANPRITKAYVNNGGDIALYLGPGETLTTAIATGTPATLTLTTRDPWRGIATSGWQGRSHSLGVADSVTVLATTTARADAAATLIANAVDLPGDPRITRQPAHELAPDSDLGARLVTTHVAKLNPASRTTALNAGLRRATDYLNRGLIGAAYLTLQGDSRATGSVVLTQQPDTEHA